MNDSFESDTWEEIINNFQSDRFRKAIIKRSVRSIVITALSISSTMSIFDSVDSKIVAISSILAGVISAVIGLNGLPEASVDKDDSKN